MVRKKRKKIIHNRPFIIFQKCLIYPNTCCEVDLDFQKMNAPSINLYRCCSIVYFGDLYDVKNIKTLVECNVFHSFHILRSLMYVIAQNAYFRNIRNWPRLRIFMYFEMVYSEKMRNCEIHINCEIHNWKRVRNKPTKMKDLCHMSGSIVKQLAMKPYRAAWFIENNIA